MIGLKSDGAGNWAWVDGSPVDMDLLIAHSFDGLQVVIALDTLPCCTPHPYCGRCFLSDSGEEARSLTVPDMLRPAGHRRDCRGDLPADLPRGMVQWRAPA